MSAKRRRSALMSRNAAAPPSSRIAGPARKSSSARNWVCANAVLHTHDGLGDGSPICLATASGAKPGCSAAVIRPLRVAEVVPEPVDVLPVEVGVPHAGAGSVMVGTRPRGA